MEQVGGLEPGRGSPVAPARRPEIEADLAGLATLAAELDGIEAALGRIDTGRYGCCTSCGAPLGDEALQADPLRVTCPAHG